MRIAYLSTFYPFRGGIACLMFRFLENSKAGHTTQAFTFTTQYPQFFISGETQFVQENDIVDKIDFKEF